MKNLYNYSGIPKESVDIAGSNPKKNNISQNPNKHNAPYLSRCIHLDS
jgi:hypothetical protein